MRKLTLNLKPCYFKNIVRYDSSISNPLFSPNYFRLLSYALFSFLPLLSLLNQLHFHNYWFKRRNKRKCNIACVMFIYLFYMVCKNIKLYISILFYKGTKIAKITHFHLKYIYIYPMCISKTIYMHNMG